MSASRIIKIPNRGEIQLFEALANGTNKFSLRAAAAMAADYGWTLPAADAVGYVVSDGAGNLSFLGGTTNNQSLDQVYHVGQSIVANVGAVDIQSTGGLKVAGPALFANGPWIDVTHPTFGADPTGTIDSTTAIQAALNSVGTNGGTVYLPAGIYKHIGLICTKDKTTVFAFGNAKLLCTIKNEYGLRTGVKNDVTFIGLIAEGTGKDDGGTSSGRGALHISQGALRCRIIDCKVFNASGSGIVDDGEESVVVNNYIDVTGEHGIYSSSSLNAVICGNTFKRVGLDTTFSLVIGMKIDGSSYCTINDNIIIDAIHMGVAFTGSSSRSSFCGNVIKGSGQESVYISTGDDLVIVGNYIETSATSHSTLQINQGKRNLIASNKIYCKASPGASWAAVHWTTSATGGDSFIGNQITFDGAFTASNGIIVGNNVDKLRISDNFIRLINAAQLTIAVSMTGTNHKFDHNEIRGAGTAVYMEDALTGTSVENNDVGSSITTGIRTPTSMGTNIVRYNQGFKTESAGTDTLGASSTSKTVTHGLNWTPLVENISIIFTAIPTSQVGEVSIANITSTTFDFVTRTSPGGAGLTFGWSVKARV